MTYLGTGNLCIHSDTTNNSTTFTDSSANHYTLTANGNVKHSTTQQKFGASSIYFDGSGDYLSGIPLASLLTNSSWTVDCWVNLETSLTVYGHGICGCLSGTNVGWGISVLGTNYTTNQNKVALFTNGDWRVYSNTISLNTWNHIAIVCNAGSINIAVNGIFGSTPYTGTKTTNGTNITIGSQYASPTANFAYKGFLDEFRIVVGQAVWTANFIPPNQIYSDTMYKVSGYTKINDEATIANVRLYDNTSGNFIAQVTSNSEGFFEYNTLASNSAVDVVAIAPNSQYNDQVYRVTPIIVV